MPSLLTVSHSNKIRRGLIATERMELHAMFGYRHQLEHNAHVM